MQNILRLTEANKPSNMKRFVILLFLLLLVPAQIGFTQSEVELTQEEDVTQQTEPANEIAEESDPTKLAALVGLDSVEQDNEQVTVDPIADPLPVTQAATAVQTTEQPTVTPPVTVPKTEPKKQNNFRAQDGLIVQYKKLRKPKKIYINKNGQKIDTNTGNRVGSARKGERITATHIVVRGKKAPNGKVFGYFYWVKAKRGETRSDIGIRVDKGFEIKPGMRIRNHMPLTNQIASGGTCTAPRVWHKGLDNRVVIAVQKFQMQTGKTVQFTTATRTYNEQACLYRKFGPGKAARPGCSNHNRGLAIDVSEEFANGKYNGQWRKVGLHKPVAGERWHLSPIGVGRAC